MADGYSCHRFNLLFSACVKHVYEGKARKRQFEAQFTNASLRGLPLNEEELRTSLSDLHGLSNVTVEQSPQPLRALYFRIPQESVVALKKELNTLPSSTNYETTVAFLWRSMLKARTSLGHVKPSMTSTLHHAVNIRGKKSDGQAPVSYTGNALGHCRCDGVEISSLLAADGLKTAASALRSSIDGTDIDQVRKSLAGMIALGPNSILFTIMRSRSTDFMVSSTQQLRNHEDYDFRFGFPQGCIGAAAPWDGFVRIMPSPPGSGIACVLTVQETIADELQREDEFSSHVTLLDAQPVGYGYMYKAAKRTAKL
ncbi:hypothetical protein K431DRAFT_313325 [Polychaeton citri CBS 116435]|uniref:Uncharacterized protein n=1 Tax=Polychaeton citri CBS 116435 TaxID=1314669 RepID=A0A9P4Q9D6_9PEZI|nr:hypothetical protein K431DRAFT_313325 [Polychaeton citri CBS 116435]